jgi:hypothetical protein
MNKMFRNSPLREGFDRTEFLDKMSKKERACEPDCYRQAIRQN